MQYYNLSLNNINLSVRETIFDNKFYIYKPTIHEQILLWWDIFAANRLLSSFDRLHNVSWNFCFFNSKHNIENNYPHTHGDTIFLSSSHFFLSAFARLKILIHEKIHIYQRYYPIPYNKILKDFFDIQICGFLPYHKDYENVRRNPDNNLLIYADHGEYILPLFKKNPTQLNDVINKVYESHNLPSKYKEFPTNEHPNETFAYAVTDMIINKQKIPYHKYL